MSGDFVSVTLDEAVIRLDKIVQSGLTEAERRTFKKVAQHRNKMVHFYHEASTQEERDEVRLAVLKEQLTAWYLLNKILTDRWQSEFGPWRVQIAEIVEKLARHKTYLRVSFDHSKADIAAAMQNGFDIRTCPSCGYDADKHAQERRAIYQTQCIVCGFSQPALTINCPDCDELVIFRGDGYAKCNGCDRDFEPDDLADLLDDGGARHIAAMDGEFTELGNCSECDGYHTIATTESGNYICASCLTQFDSLEYCEWCGDANSGDMEYSGWKGCNHCDGRADWEK